MAEVIHARNRRSVGWIMLRLAALGILTAMAGALTFGYLGRLHGAFDSFAHFRIHIAAAMVVFALLLVLLRFRIEAGFAAAFGALAIVQTVGLPFNGGANPVSAASIQPHGAVYRLMQLNLRYDNPTPQAVLSLIGRVRPDVVTLDEVSREWVPWLERLEATYPYQIVCPPPARIGGSAVISRRPFAKGTEAYCGDRGAFAHATLDLGGRAVEFVALHLGWPWPFEQPWQLPRLTPLLAQVADTAVIAGDFNAVPWSATVRRVAQDADARILRGIGPTWLARPAPDWLRRHAGLPIDNVLVKGAVLPLSLGTIEPAGSDHLPVLLEFTLAPEEPEPAVLQARLSDKK